LRGGKDGDAALNELPIPSHHKWVPDSVPQGPPFNVAQMWSRFAEAIRSGNRAEPDFDTAVTRHRLLEAIQRASDTGQRQSV
jgi:predicted dehydrogenase